MYSVLRKTKQATRPQSNIISEPECRVFSFSISRCWALVCFGRDFQGNKPPKNGPFPLGIFKFLGSLGFCMAPAPRGLPNPRIWWHSASCPPNVARIWQSEPSTMRNPKEPRFGKSFNKSSPSAEPEAIIRQAADPHPTIRSFDTYPLTTHPFRRQAAGPNPIIRLGRCRSCGG
ncbi:MAG: hypothetical protein MAG451_03250 [Anaerolineales bacterium]|nr:hypothetical protein [Anaerolineales bacterium]